MLPTIPPCVVRHKPSHRRLESLRRVGAAADARPATGPKPPVADGNGPKALQQGYDGWPEDEEETARDLTYEAEAARIRREGRLRTERDLNGGEGMGATSVWATDSKSDAQAYADTRHVDLIRYGKDPVEVIPVEVALDNPFIVDFRDCNHAKQ
jgi:hypothetical protein